MDEKLVFDTLAYYWAYKSFRPLQKEIVFTVLNQKNCLALLPTSAGKSLTFQLPALLLPGITLVVTPLISLMKNQVENLKKRGVLAEAIYSGMHKKVVDRLLDNCVHGDVKLLYLSPERLQSSLFLERAKRMKISLLVVDEAHCISEWGYDFRPPYLQIAQFNEHINKVPILALTASANEKVLTDILEKLAIPAAQKYKLSFARDNISYLIYHTADKERLILNALNTTPGSGIIYTRSRAKTHRIVRWLATHGIMAGYYHAGLEPEIRDQQQQAWMRNDTRVIVATSAFGMGIDKPDVRLVIHIDLPESVEAYYQEAGRAGRDGLPSYAILAYQKNDGSRLLQRINDQYPGIEQLRAVYQALANYYQIPVGAAYLETYALDIAEFIKRFDFKEKETIAALKLFENLGHMQFGEAMFEPARLKIIIDKKAIYNYSVSQPVLGEWLTVLLRTYGAELLYDYLPIKEQNLARQHKTTKKEIQNILKQLHKAEVVEYLHQNISPKITYLEARQDAKSFRIDTEKINFLKNKHLSNAEALIELVENNELCRQLQMLHYFDEKTKTPCGQCDVCRLEKMEAKKDKTIKKLKTFVIETLQQNSQTVEVLKQITPPQYHQYLAIALQELMEEERINMNGFEFGVRS